MSDQQREQLEPDWEFVEFRAIDRHGRIIFLGTGPVRIEKRDAEHPRFGTGALTPGWDLA